MSVPLPNPRDYDVSLKTGFLPEELPLEKLPPYFSPWEKIASNLPALLVTKKVRRMVDEMPLLNANKLSKECEWQRAVSILGFMAHAYVWSHPEPCDHLPVQLAEPLLLVNARYDLPPLSTFAGLCLWNFRQLVDADEELTKDTRSSEPGAPETAPPPPNWLDCLATLTTFTGALDESWFYLVSIAIERQGAPSIKYGLEAIQAARDDDCERVIRCLEGMAENIDGLSSLLMRMYEMCDPHYFYFKMRPYMAGWSNMTEAGLPHGVRYGNETEYRAYSGGSNGQSSLIQTLDILLNVEHHPTGERRPPRMAGFRAEAPEGIKASGKGSYLLAMRKYMPIKHRKFLEHLERVAEIREYVLTNKEKNKELVTAYDACLATLKGLRSKHIQIVTRYIIMNARESSASNTNGLATGDGTVGTGGTTLLPFLKQARDEVGDVAAGTWGRRLLTHRDGPDKDAPQEPRGLGGLWK